MTAQKKKFLVRAIANMEKYSRVVLAATAVDAEKFVLQNTDKSTVIYSVNEVTDVEPEVAENPAPANQAVSVVPWFGGYNGIN